jgi:hypothetical protein
VSGGSAIEPVTVAVEEVGCGAGRTVGAGAGAGVGAGVGVGAVALVAAVAEVPGAAAEAAADALISCACTVDAAALAPSTAPTQTTKSVELVFDRAPNDGSWERRRGDFTEAGAHDIVDLPSYSG